MTSTPMTSTPITRSAIASSAMTNASARSPGTHQLRRFLTDVLCGMLLYAAVAGAFSIQPGNAFPAPPPYELTLADTKSPTPAAFVPSLKVAAPVFPSYDGPSAAYGHILLASILSLLAAFNLAVLRHLRTAYASPRRRS